MQVLVRWVLLSVLALSLTAQAQSGKSKQPTDLQAWSGTWATSPDSLGGLMAACCIGKADNVPLTEAARQQRNSFVNRQAAERLVITNSASCTPDGVPGTLSHPILFEILFTQGRATLIFENGEVRRIWLDGRKHLPLDELGDSFEGDSIGHWEGTTLVVDTIGMSPRADIFMANGIRATDQTHVVEKMRLKDKQTLQIDFTVTDSKIFTKPYEYTVLYQQVPGTFEVGCQTNNRDDGTKPVDLSPP
ncbi:MAG: hypothetical protein QM808_04555 [Steroidobacteraceae bacterium]